jgi:hypothetical protein
MGRKKARFRFRTCRRTAPSAKASRLRLHNDRAICSWICRSRTRERLDARCERFRAASMSHSIAASRSSILAGCDEFGRKKPASGMPERGLNWVQGLDLNQRSRSRGIISRCGADTAASGGRKKTRVRMPERGLNWVQGLDLNQRPSGYEPDELPGCSTLQWEAESPCAYPLCQRHFGFFPNSRLPEGPGAGVLTNSAATWVVAVVLNHTHQHQSIARRPIGRPVFRKIHQIT